jgi:hypothetical protein
MHLFTKLGMIAVLIASLFAELAHRDGPATSPMFAPVVSTAGELSATHTAETRLHERLRALRAARAELEVAQRIIELRKEFASEPAFFAYIANLLPVLETAYPRLGEIRSHVIDINSLLALTYGLSSARAGLEADVSSLPSWLLLCQAVRPESRWVTPPARFVSNSVEMMFGPADELTVDDVVLVDAVALMG